MNNSRVALFSQCPNRPGYSLELRRIEENKNITFILNWIDNQTGRAYFWKQSPSKQQMQKVAMSVCKDESALLGLSMGGNKMWIIIAILFIVLIVSGAYFYISRRGGATGTLL